MRPLINKHVRMLVHASTEGACVYCDAALSAATCTIDHVRPRSKGGEDKEENLVPCCATCNQLRGRKQASQMAHPKWLALVSAKEKNQYP